MQTGLITYYRSLSGNVRGALWVLASSMAFTLMASLVKYTSSEYGASLQTFYRQLAAVIVLAPIILRNPVAAFRTTRPGILLFRSAAAVVSLNLSFYAYQWMPLADANALSFTRTLWMVPLAAFVLREAVGPRRLAATLVGFCGVLLMLRPSTAPLGLPALAALGSALLIAVSVTGMKIMTRDHSTLTVVSWAAVLGLLLATPGALIQWKWPNLTDLGLLAAMGALGVINQACYVKGISLGEAVAVAPVDYSRLIFAAAFGFVLFHEVPDLLGMAGALLVMASTLYITLHEARARRSTAAPPPPEAV